MAQRRGHRGFARFWSWMVRHEGKEDRATRQEVAGGARGRVLEIGVGVGSNWLYLPPGLAYTGIEPDPYMLERARPAAPPGIEVLEAAAEDLPFESASFDTVFTTLTFCTIADVPAALSEVRRVLKPGGEFRFWEHVRPSGRAWGRVADVATPVWKRLGGGCHPNRNTEAAIRAAGFEVRELCTSKRGPIPMLVGVAVVPAEPGSAAGPPRGPG